MTNIPKSVHLLMSSILIAALCSPAFGQAEEQDPAQSNPDSGTESQARRSRIYFIDTPVELESGVEQDIDWPLAIPTPPSEEDPQFSARMESIRQYDESVREIEAEGGVWDASLIEQLHTLGELQQQQGDHVSAIATFDRAVHVSRINNGLHTMEQLPAVEQKIESYLATGNWEQADLYYNYMFYVQQKTYGSSDPRLIPILGRLANWNLRAFNIGFGESLGVRLNSAQLLFDAAAQLVDMHFGRSDQRYLDYQQNIANAAYLVSRHPEIMNDADKAQFRLDQDALQQKLMNTDRVLARGFQAGEEALLNIVNQNNIEPVDAIAVAKASANLGDWYLMFERKKAAAARYAHAWKVLSELDNSEELLAEFFGHVIPLPTFLEEPTSLVFSSRDTRDTSELKVGFVDLVFDVTANGVVRKLEVVSEETEETEAILGRLRREVRRSLFRPVIEGGEPIRTSGNQFRYRYWY
ncbi:MAG: hypothetical protein AB8B95_04495 [Pseudohongiellaceae bacterium]